MPDTIRARFHIAFPSERGQSFCLDVDAMLPGSGIIAIFGHSGSGKTTLLRCIAGLQKIDRGRLIVNGETWQDEKNFLPTHKRQLGYVFQEASLFPHLCGRDNLEYALKRSGGHCQPKMVQRVIALMGIEPVLDRYPDQMSGGERQRVAIARALLIRPRLLLMDEPLASLDMARKQEILPYLERLRAEFAIPILYVSHSMYEVARLADYLLVLDKGRVAAQGAVSDVLSQLNLPLGFGEEAGVVLTGKVLERDSRWHLVRIGFSGGELWLPDNSDLGKEALRVRILARDVSLALEARDDTSVLNRLPVEVCEIGAGSNEATALVRLKCGDSYIIASLTRKSLARLRIEPGMKVWAQIKSAAIVQ
ncbi:molybdate transport system ATP-binding protein [Microbulbifer thermotolerans]|uniref:molybdenum ABC transporter ATP-binding protein n=1 Tax=Microbulbifer thermotolerans TaxID=252514 RepID=UPI0008F230EB|nr:molybdenum ABC transporter ATP-binding protein [Microbulbifer thermotolerans]SFB86091.1 molybdate transport system ATP-binding protein [Microbulbifer thermotolerans]